MTLSRVFHEKPKLVEKFLALYGTRRSINRFTKLSLASIPSQINPVHAHKLF